MTQNARRRPRSASTSSRKNSLRRLFMRSLSGAEQLENRSLMAGDVYSGYWNPAWPTDVNVDRSVDPQDVLTIVDSLSRNGMGALAPPATVPQANGSEGESQAAANRAFIDVDRDGELSPADVLWVLNAMDPKPEGAGELVKFRVAAVAIGTPNTSGDAIDTVSGVQSFHPGNGGSTNPTPARTLTEVENISGVAVIDKGSAFELRFYVTDQSSVDSLGVFSGYFDVDYNASKAAPVVNEIQAIQFNTDTDFTGGNFTITYNNQTVTVNPVFQSGVMSRTQTATAIKNALVPILPGGANSLDVVYINPLVSGAPTYRWELRFKGSLENQNLSAVVVNPANLLGGTNVQEVVDEFDGSFTGTTTNTTAFRRSFVPSTAIITDPVDSSATGRAYTSLVASADALQPNVMNEIGTLAQTSTPRPGTTEREFLRVKMLAVDATTPGSPMQFVLSPADLASSKTLIFGHPDDVINPLTEIDYGAAFQLIVREYVSANADLYTTQNATVVAGNTYSLNVTANDTSLSSLPFQVVSTTTGSMGGSISIGAGNQSIQYTPANGFQIAPQGASGPNVQTETFVYTIAATDSNLSSQTAYRDTATVTVNLIVPNAPPVNSLPASVTFSEGGTFTFSGANTISVSDADAGSVGLDSTLTVSAGTLTLAGGNQAGVTGSGTSTVAITNQTLSNLNTILANLVYTPTNTNANGVVTLTMVTDDNGSGIGLVASDTDVININITAVNDAPTQTLPAPGLETTDEDNLAVPGISVADVDLAEGNGSHTVTTTVAVASGSFGTLAVTPSGSVITGGINSASLTITGSLADVNNTLATLIYKPQLNAVAVMTINVTTSDNGNSPAPAQTATGSFDINVKAKARPKAVDDTPANGVNYTFAEETTTITNLSPNVLANDQIHDGSTALLNGFSNVTLNFAPALGGGTQPAPAGLITQSGDDIVFNGTFLPADFFGTITFDYLMDDTFGPDEAGADYTGSVQITITNVNDAPVAVTDPLQTVAEDGQIDINVVSNDTDADNDTLTATIVDNPANGVILTNAAGVVTYKPNANYFGLDSFTYRANDGTTTSTNLVTVTIDVTPVNDAPVTTNFGASTSEGTAATIDFTGRITDVDDAVNLASVVVGNVKAGDSLTQNPDNTWTYTTGNPDFHGTVSFTYTANDGNAGGLSNTSTVTLTISPVNDNPGATDDVMQTGEGQTMDFDVLANDYDVDASATFIPVDGTLTAGTTISIVTNPSHGSASVVTVGNRQFIRYTPSPATYNGPDSLVYRLTDNDSTTPGSLTSNDATVNIDVLPKNDPPVAVADPGITVNEDNSVSIDVFANDSDPDTASTQWSFVPVVQPAHGSITFNTTTRRVDYTPAANYAGPDSFSYKINDNSPIAPTNQESNTVVVSITVNEVNDAPVFNPVQTGIVIANGSIDYVNEIPILSFVNSGVDNPALDQPFVISYAGSPTNGSLRTTEGGTLTITPNGTILYKAPAGMKDFNDSFDVTVTDRNGTGISVTQMVSFFVQEAVPFNLRLNVFADALLNGVKDSFEVGLGGIPFTITGTDFRGQAFSQTLTTDRNGQLNVLNLFPGTYIVDQVENSLIQDGRSSFNANDPRITRLGDESDDRFQVTVGILPPAGFTPDVTINFGEWQGASSQAMSYAQNSIAGARPYASHIVSTNSTGALIGMSGSQRILGLMQGWANVDRMEITNVTVNSNGSGSGTLRVWAVGSNTPVEVRIPLNQSAGFSIIGGWSDGSRMYQLNATAARLGLTQFVPSGSGESFTSGADAFFGDLGV